MNGSEYGWLALVLHTGETDRRQDKEYFIGHSKESFRLDPELTQSILDGGFRVFGAGGFFSGVESTEETSLRVVQSSYSKDRRIHSHLSSQRDLETEETHWISEIYKLSPDRLQLLRDLVNEAIFDRTKDESFVREPVRDL